MNDHITYESALAETAIRADERSRIAALITEHEGVLASFTGEGVKAIRLLAFLLTLENGPSR